MDEWAAYIKQCEADAGTELGKNLTFEVGLDGKGSSESAKKPAAKAKVTADKVSMSLGHFHPPLCDLALELGTPPPRPSPLHLLAAPPFLTLPSFPHPHLDFPGAQGAGRQEGPGPAQASLDVNQDPVAQDPRLVQGEAVESGGPQADVHRSRRRQQWR